MPKIAVNIPDNVADSGAVAAVNSELQELFDEMGRRVILDPHGPGQKIIEKAIYLAPYTPQQGFSGSAQSANETLTCHVDDVAGYGKGTRVFIGNLERYFFESQPFSVDAIRWALTEDEVI